MLCYLHVLIGVYCFHKVEVPDFKVVKFTEIQKILLAGWSAPAGK